MTREIVSWLNQEANRVEASFSGLIVSAVDPGGQPYLRSADLPIFYQKLGQALEIDNPGRLVLGELYDWFNVVESNFSTTVELAKCMKFVALHTRLIQGRVAEEQLLSEEMGDDGKFVLKLRSLISKDMVGLIYSLPPLLGVLEVCGHLGALVLNLHQRRAEASQQLENLVENSSDNLLREVLVETERIMAVRPVMTVQNFLGNSMEPDRFGETMESRRSMFVMADAMSRAVALVDKWKAARQADAAVVTMDLANSVIKPYGELEAQLLGFLSSITDEVLLPLVGRLCR